MSDLSGEAMQVNSDPTEGRRLEGPLSIEQIALELWKLLDNIDTLDDACKDNDKAFRTHCYRVQQKRYSFGTSDGYNVKFNTK